MLKNLKKLRDEAGVSQKSLAESIGVSQQSINKYENHNIEPDIETLILMADYFNTSIDYLVGRTDVRHKIEPVHTYELNNNESKILNGYRRADEQIQQIITLLVGLK